MDTQAFRNAKNSLMGQDYKAAERSLKKTLDSLNEHEEGLNSIMSYYGLSQVMNGNLEGLLICRDAASNEKSDGDVFLNLACAEWQSDNRKRAIEAIQHGLKIAPDHTRLRNACGKLDCRKRCCFGFLSRSHKLNRLFGRWRRRTDNEVLTVHGLLYS